MYLTDMILVIENDKGTEINSLMNFDEYMEQYGTKIEQTPMELAKHTFVLEKTRQDAGMWAELYRVANKSVGARYCYDLDRLCNFLVGVHNDSHSEHYLDEQKCSQECLTLLEEKMMQKGVYVVAFSYPVVPKGRARIRTQVCASQTKEDIGFVIQCLKESSEEIGK